MDEKAGAQISKKAFIQSALIILLLMLVAGVLTRVLPLAVSGASWWAAVW